MNKFDKWFFGIMPSIDKREKRSKVKKNILPAYVLKKRIRIINDGTTIYDSAENKNESVPIEIQYAIKSYGGYNKRKPEYVYKFVTKKRPGISIQDRRPMKAMITSSEVK